MHSRTQTAVVSTSTDAACGYTAVSGAVAIVCIVLVSFAKKEDEYIVFVVVGA